MRQRTAAIGFTTLAVVAAAASVTRTPIPPSPGSPTDRNPGAAAPAPGMGGPASLAARPPYHRGRELLQQFFGARRHSPNSGLYDFDALIAMLPDPTDSHLDWAFDTELEAIRRAFETSGFVTDGFWLPSPRDTISWQEDGRVVVAARRDREPGVILFRHTDPLDPRLRLLYIVPEIPTSGIYKAAFAAALEERDSLVGQEVLPLKIDRARPTRIIGPAFSGSALSLQLALRDRPGPPDSVEIVSGSATSLNNEEILTCPRLRIHFSATLNPDESLNEALAGVLDSLRVPPSRVALLQESSTQYGQSVVQSDGSGDTATTAQPTACGGARPQGGSPAPGYLVVPFPGSISSLRTEYQRLPTGSEVGVTLPGSAAPPRLPLDLLDPGRPKEDLPVTSRLTPPTVDLILDEVAHTLREHGIRMVGLLATDVRDKLFLGEELKARMRDVQFFTFESNILYLRPDHSRSMRGMLVFSTYPLLVQPHSRWETDSLHHFAFSSDAAEGVYNATLVQLGQQKGLRDYGRPRTETARPPVWLTTVGSRVFLPVTRIDSTSFAACYVEPRSRPLKTPSCPVGVHATGGRAAAAGPAESIAFLPFASTTLGGVLLILFAVASWQGGSRARFWGPVTPNDLQPPVRALWQQVQSESLAIHERLYTLLRLIAVLSVFIAAGVPLLKLLRGDTQRPLASLSLGIAGLAGTIGGVALLTAAVGLLYSAAGSAKAGWRFGWTERWGTRTQRVFWRLEVIGRTLIGLWGVVYLSLSLWFGLDVWQLQHLKRLGLFLLRAAELDSFVSPLLPLIFAGTGFAVWAFWHLRRVELLRRPTVFERACVAAYGGPRGARPSVGTAFHDDLWRAAGAVEQVRARLFLLLPGAGGVVLMAFFLVLFAWLWPQFGATPEALTLPRRVAGLTSFDWLFRLSILASLLSIGWATYRLLAVWRALQECLMVISAMPILPAFERLPARLGGMARFRLSGSATGLQVGFFADEQWLHLQRIYDLGKEQFSAHLPAETDLPTQIAELMSHSCAEPLVPDTQTLQTQACRFSTLHHVLCELWKLEPMREDLDLVAPDLARATIAGPTASTTGRLRRTFAGPVRLWLRAAEEYAAVQMAQYLEWAMRQLRVLALFLLLSLLLTTGLLSSYPFYPQSLLKLVFFCLMLATVGSVVFVLMQANRDEVLSRLNQTEPGRVTWDTGFVLNLVTFGLVPFLTLLASEVPELRDLLLGWVEPIAKLVAKQ